MTRPKATAFSFFMRFYGWAAGFLVLVGLCATLAAFSFAQRASLLDREGVEIQARVNATWSERVSRRSFNVEVGYQVDGVSYAHTASVTEGFMDWAEEQGTIPIRYWPKDPSVIELQGGQLSNWFWWSLALACVGIFGGGYWCWKIWTRVAQMQWLDKNGERHSVKVLARAKSGTTINGVEQVHLIWEEPDGGRCQSALNDPLRFQDYPEGTEIEVLRDPSGQRPSIWAGDLEVWP
ncbi:MAG: hypothetical protein AAGF79_03755 [Pseudomonadota bacterium]